MNLGELILTLRPLLDDPRGNAPRIVELLDGHRSLAEFEVARFYVSRAFAPVIEAQARSQDPRERALAARGNLAVMARSLAARLLRRLVKDPDPVARNAARAAVRRLGLDDVALPDTRFQRPRSPRALAPGGWNPTGWAFGLFRGRGAKAQLTRTGSGKVQKPTLPKITTVAELATFLGLKNAGALKRLLRPGTEPGSAYVAFEIAKATGGTRTIHAPRPTLKKAQRRILDEIVAHIPAHEACHGFVKGRSVVTNAEGHRRAAVILKIDLLDFFPSIHFRRVEGLFEYYGYPPEVARALAGLVTHRPVLADGTVAWPGVLPQGAPTSPAIANALCRRLDARLSRLARKAGAWYTRYADDLTFSFVEPRIPLGRFFWWVDQICQAEGFTENAKKRRVLRRHMQQRVTGVVVNDRPTVPRATRRKFRALLARCRKDGLAAVAEALARPNLGAEIAGFAAWVQMVQPDLGAALAAQVRALRAAAGEAGRSAP